MHCCLRGPGTAFYEPGAWGLGPRVFLTVAAAILLKADHITNFLVPYF